MRRMQSKFNNYILAIGTINIVVSIAIINYKNNKYEDNRTKSRTSE